MHAVQGATTGDLQMLRASKANTGIASDRQASEKTNDNNDVAAE